jgi:hypothetical protein
MLFTLRLQVSLMLFTLHLQISSLILLARLQQVSLMLFTLRLQVCRGLGILAGQFKLVVVTLLFESLLPALQLLF